MDAIIQESRERLAGVSRVTVSMGPAVVDPKVVRLQVRPVDALTPIRRALREAIAAVRGPERVNESDDWTPHVSVAYSNSDGPMSVYLKALEPQLEPVPVEIPDVRLIILDRDTHLYQWQTRAVTPLGR